jgi:hypothetical protein
MMTPEEIRILRAMTPEQKLRAMERLYWILLPNIGIRIFGS